MSKYLRKWEKKYRCMAPYDEATGKFARDPLTQEEIEANKELDKDERRGSMCENDLYIACQGKDMIYDYDSTTSTMEAHFDSRIRGRNIVEIIYNEHLGNFKKDFVGMEWEDKYRAINALDNPVMNHIQDNSSELWFRFNGNKHMDYIAKLMKAKKPMASTSPFSVKYLPEHQAKLAEKRKKKREENLRFHDYEMPKHYWDDIKTEVPRLAKLNKCKIDVALNSLYESFGKKVKVDLIAEADKNNYKINHYIHKIGKWNAFVKFSKTLTKF